MSVERFDKKCLNSLKNYPKSLIRNFIIFYHLLDKNSAVLFRSYFKYIPEFRVSSYSFSLAEKLLGIKMLIFGYNYAFYEQKINKKSALDQIQINNVKIWAPRNLFKTGELLHIYSEIFVPYYSNPHAYEFGGAEIYEGDIVIDAGACEGFFIDYALNKGAKKVIAIEPLQKLVDCLKLSFDMNVQNKSVKILPYALSNKKGIDCLNTDFEYICEAKIDNNGIELCETITIDDSVQMCHLDNVDFIKMLTSKYILTLLIYFLQFFWISLILRY